MPPTCHSPSTLRLQELFQRFFTEYLPRQRRVSPQTLAAYRDTFRLFFSSSPGARRPSPTALDLLGSETVARFLDGLETQRHNSPTTRNARLAAFRSFARYALPYLDGTLSGLAQRILALPFKRCTRRLVGFLSQTELTALLQATDATWSGRRDQLLFTLLYNTGARISEVVSLRVRQVQAPEFRWVELHGKGRKDRTVPLWPKTRTLLRRWIKGNRLLPDHLLFTNRLGQPLSRFGARQRLRQLAAKARTHCPSLAHRRISPHSLRHTMAMHLLQAGVAPVVISLWLGHESPNTTHRYIEADLTLKEKALRRLRPPQVRSTRFRPKGALLRFLERL
jgi:integrase/recombinase XerD